MLCKCNVPEQYYGKLAKIENLKVHYEVPVAVVSTVAAVEPATTGNVPPDAGNQNDKIVPKLSLRRESTAGANWMKIATVSTVAPGTTKAVPRPKEKEFETRPVTVMTAAKTTTGKVEHRKSGGKSANWHYLEEQFGIERKRLESGEKFLVKSTHTWKEKESLQ